MVKACDEQPRCCGDTAGDRRELSQPIAREMGNYRVGWLEKP